MAVSSHRIVQIPLRCTWLSVVMYIHCPVTKKNNTIKKKNPDGYAESTERHAMHVTEWKKKKGCSSHATSVPKKNNKWEEGNSCVYFVENFFRTVGEKRAPVSCGKGFV